LRTTLSRFLNPGREQKVSVRTSSSSAISSSSQTPVGNVSYFGKENSSRKNITLSASWKKTKLRMIAWIIDNLAYVSGERRRINDAPTLLCALHAIVDMYLAEYVRCHKMMARRVDRSQ
jgi:hypothetical protein